MRKNTSNLKLLLSLTIGFIGIFLLSINFLVIALGKGPTYTRWDYTIWKKIVDMYFEVPKKLPPLLELLVGILIEGAFLIFFPLSLIGIFLGIKSLSSPKRKFAIFAVLLNSINMLFALFIAWFLFGLARGM
jgi:hypothetical protein